jgi:hypothetical protein
MPHVRMPPPSRLTAAAVLAGLALTGCAGSSDVVPSLLVAPGKYDIYTCPQIVKAFQATQKRERELQALMVKAGTGVGGQLVSATVYQPDYQAARGDMNDLRQAARDKNCDLTAPTAAPASKPAAAAKPAAKPASKPR